MLSNCIVWTTFIKMVMDLSEAQTMDIAKTAQATGVVR